MYMYSMYTCMEASITRISFFLAKLLSHLNRGIIWHSLTWGSILSMRLWKRQFRESKVRRLDLEKLWQPDSG